MKPRYAAVAVSIALALLWEPVLPASASTVASDAATAPMPLISPADLPETTSAHPLNLLAVANGAASGDRMCWQETPAWITAVAQVDGQTGATHGTVEVPMDNTTAYVACRPAPLDPVAYESIWISALRQAGLHVWFRQQWNSWAGSYGARKLTYASRPAVPYETRGGASAVLQGQDMSSYLARTYHYILDHPHFYADGDVFTPVGEPQDAGIGQAGCGCQFPSLAAMNRFLRDSITVDRVAFAKLGVHVLVGLDGTSCDTADLEPATVAVMGAVGVDCYVSSAAELAKDLAFVHNAYHAPIVLSEWGAIFNQGKQPATSRSISSALQAVIGSPFVAGFDYWQSYGGTSGENVVEAATLTISASGRELQHWYQVSAALGQLKKVRLGFTF
jgi:hypothetical protein